MSHDELRGWHRALYWRRRAEAAEAQVAAVRALADEWEQEPMPRASDHDGVKRIHFLSGQRYAAAKIRAALSSSEPVNAGPDVERFGTIGGVEFYTDKPEPVGNDGLTDAERRELAAEWRAQHERLPIATEGDET